MYDKDKSETIQLGEMVELFGTLYLNEGLEMDAAVERAQAIFATLDVNNDGDVTEEEFVRGCLEVDPVSRPCTNNKMTICIMTVALIISGKNYYFKDKS